MSSMRKKPFIAALTLALAIALLMSTGLTATFAADIGSITVHKFSRTTAGSVTSNTYTGEMITDTSGLGRPLENAGFSLFRLNTTALNTALANGNKYVSHVINTDNSVTFTLDGTGTPAVTTVKAAATIVGSEQFTNASGVTKFDTLADGYYVLVETTTPTGFEPCEKSVIRLPLTLADGSGHNRDLHVYPKNTVDTIPVSKNINGTPKVLAVGNQIKFDIVADFRNDKADPDHVASVHDLRNDTTPPPVYGKAYVIDSIQSYFKYISVDSVKLLDGAGAVISTLTLTTDYTIDATGLNAAGNGPLKVTLTNAGIDKAIAADAASYVVTITTEYLGATAGIGSATTPVIKNVVSSAVVKAGSNDDGDWPEDEAFVPTTMIALDKTDNNGVAFAGAKFRLAKVANPTSASDYVQTPGGTIIELTTDASGNISFYNLPYNETTGTTYYLQEVATKPGWQLKTMTIAVTLQPKSASVNAHLLDGNGDWIEGAVVTATATVKNYPNGTPDPEEPTFALPLTGGAGVMFFTALGTLVMVLAAVAYLKKRSLCK